MSNTSHTPLPNTRYSIIYADPPWQFDSKMRGKVGAPWDNSPERHYPTMSTPDIKAIPVQQITAEDALLFLWVTGAHLDVGIEVGRAWGFDYKTVGFVWDKQRLNPGYYTLQQCEYCLVFKHGRIPQPRGKRNIRQFLSEHRRLHSQKPDTVRHRIIEMFPTQNKIELFARQRVPGWDAWGNEV